MINDSNGNERRILLVNDFTLKLTKYMRKSLTMTTATVKAKLFLRPFA